MPEKIIRTIGHSTHSAEEFIGMLKAFSIAHLVDIRSYPGSRRYPHFNKEALQQVLLLNTIHYTHMPELGGRRKPKADSKNTAWKNESFRGYADFMESGEFKQGIERLESIALRESTAYMCSEAVWWKCHRSLVSDCLKARGWKVLHIMNSVKEEEHPFTKPARIVGDELRYY
jgi:uncharacterized protein (DUF488 family)